MQYHAMSITINCNVFVAVITVAMIAVKPEEAFQLMY
jgi:hypothetical protein